MAAVAAAAGMRNPAAAAGLFAGQANGIFAPVKHRHNSIDKPVMNRSRLLEDFRYVSSLSGLQRHMKFADAIINFSMPTKFISDKNW